MAKRAATVRKAKQVAVEEARVGQRNPDARTYESPIIPIEQINEAANELRADHPRVTDEQAKFVHLLIQTGKSVPELCELSGVSKHWGYYHMSKAHVADYRQAVAIRTLGWDSAAALSVMRTLLNAKSDYVKLEAARDLMDRGGMTLEPVKPSGSGAVFNFNLGGLAPVRESEPVQVEVIGMEQASALDHTPPLLAPSVGMGPTPIRQEQGGGLQNEAVAYRQGETHTRPGSEGFTIRSSSPGPRE